MALLIALLTFGLILTGAASALEISLFAVPASRLRQLEHEGARGIRTLSLLRARPASLLVTTWTLRTAGVALSVVSAWHVVGEAGGPLAVAIIGAALAAVAAVLVELAAKALAQGSGERPALLLALPTWVLAKTLTPLRLPAEALLAMLRPKFAEIMPGISDREIRDLVSPGNGEAVIEEHERRLIERAFLLDQTTAYDVMTPRVDILAWPESRTLAAIAPELRTARYSRIPLYRETIDKITGVLYTRDAYQALISGQRDVRVGELAREPFFVPGSITLDRLLLDFQARRIHMGIVIDEYGGVDGLIALEDILEELVGEIIDESDIAQESIIRLSRNEVLVDGGADLREINHFFNTTFPQLEHRSLNGYLLDVLGRVPEPGEKIMADAEGVLIEVTAASDTQVLRARLTRKPRGAAQGEGREGTERVEGIEPRPPSATPSVERRPVEERDSAVDEAASRPGRSRG